MEGSGILSKFATGGNKRSEQCVPCKLNNVKTRQHQKRTEVLLTSEACWKVSEIDFFEAKN